MSESKQEEPTRKERKRARKELALLLERLRQLCEAIDQVSEWKDVVADVENVLDAHQDAIPADRRRRIREAMELPEATLQGVMQACRVLQVEIEGVIKFLNVTPAVATVLTVGLIIVAVGVFAVTVIGNMRAVDVTIHNQGCGDIPVRAALGTDGAEFAGRPLLAALGIKLPDVIAEGDTEISLPPAVLEIDNEENADELKICVRGEGLMLDLAEATDIRLSCTTGEGLPLSVAEATDIRFDEVSVLGRRDEIGLSAGEAHELAIRCEN